VKVTSFRRRVKVGFEIELVEFTVADGRVWGQHDNAKWGTEGGEWGTGGSVKTVIEDYTEI